MNRLLRLASIAVPLLGGSTALAQPASDPVVWVWNQPLGLAATDSRFRSPVHYDLNWGFTITIAGQPGGIVNRDGTSVGTAVGAEVLRRGEKHPVLLLRSIGRKNLHTPELPQYGPFTSLYDYNESPTDTDRVDIGTKTFRFIWMTKGITAQSVWTNKFLDAYEAAVGHDAGYAPERIVFDQEPPSTMAELASVVSWPDIQALWSTIRSHAYDTKFASTPVPGFGTKALKQLWIDAGMPGVTSWGGDYHYVGGSAPNQTWWTWLFGVEQTAIASAMDKAFYSIVAARGGFWTGVTCCDYEGTMRSDGLAGDYSPYPANTDSFLPYIGVLGAAGTRYSQNCSGTNIVQAPHLYTDGSYYAWDYFRAGNPFSPPNAQWANTDDQHNPTYSKPGPLDALGNPSTDEFWSETNKRQWRFKLDACAKSFGAASLPIDVWVTLPNQAMQLQGVADLTHPHAYDGITYHQGSVGVHQSFRATVDSLAVAKNHHVDRLLLWNDTDQHSPSSQYLGNWNLFRRALDLVWGFNITQFYVDVTNVLPQNESPSQLVDKLAYADGPLTSNVTNRVQVNSASGGGIWAVTGFKLTGGAAMAPPNALNFRMDVVLDKSTHLYLLIYDWTNSTWKYIGVVGDVLDLDERTYPAMSEANKTMRLEASIAYSPNYRDSTDTIKLAFFASADVPGTMTGYFDMVQCYGGEHADSNCWRPLGDLNGDYVANGTDTTLFNEMYDKYALYIGAGGPVPGNIYAGYASYGAWLDLNHDGVVDLTDKGLWASDYANKTRPVDDYKRTAVDSR